MAFCPNCGNQMSDNAMFCLKCGAKLSDYSGGGSSISDSVVQRSHTATGGRDVVQAGGNIQIIQAKTSNDRCGICGKSLTSNTNSYICGSCNRTICSSCMGGIIYSGVKIKNGVEYWLDTQVGTTLLRGEGEPTYAEPIRCRTCGKPFCRDCVGGFTEDLSQRLRRGEGYADLYAQNTVHCKKCKPRR